MRFLHNTGECTTKQKNMTVSTGISSLASRSGGLVFRRNPRPLFRIEQFQQQRQLSFEKDRINSGRVSGVWVFHRHGDRTPCRPLCDEQKLEAEAKFWSTKLPSPELVSSVSKRFPVQVHPSNSPEFLDSGRKPFGCLTHKGALQMQDTGRRLKLRYNKENRPDFLSRWDVQVFSTNYLRTVTSAQCFLDGLLSPHYDSSSASPIVRVQVRDRSQDTLNAFDKHPQIMSDLVSSVVSCSSFQHVDATAAPLAARLANFLPGLAQTTKSSFGGPSGINWIHATDHFVCRDSHDVPLTCVDVPDWNLEEAMRSMAHPTMAHLAWRFRQWYKSPPLLSAIAAPPLREIGEQITEFKHNAKNGGPSPFLVYSCHDVTLLSLLYGLNADIVKQENRFWPPYASTLVFELVKMEGEEEFLVRIFLNGIGVRRDLLREEDFRKLVMGLEVAGKGVLDVDESADMERDMSGWTG